MRLLFAGLLLPLAFCAGAIAEQPVGDLNGDWEANYKDLCLFADQWLASGVNSANFDGFGRVDMTDFALFADDWRDGSGAVVISEIHCNPDLETELVEFVELHNAGTRDVNISGWTFDDGISYTFEPNTILSAGTHIIVAEDPNHIQSKWCGRGDCLGSVMFGPYTGSLDNDGERIRLRNIARETIDQVDYQLGFPWPTVGGSVPADTNGTGHSMQLMNPRLDNDLGGSWRSAAPTPAAANIAVLADNIPPQMRQVAHSPEQPASGQLTTITVKVTDPNGVATVDLEYQVVLAGQYIPAYFPVAIGVLHNNPDTEPESNPDYFDPANWTRITMRDDGVRGDAIAGDDIYTAAIADQPNRTIVRYRIRAEDTLGMDVTGPYADDPSLNFAYYVYDGVPDYEGYSGEMLESLPVYNLITRYEDMYQALGYDSLNGISVSNPARFVYNWRGTFVYDGEVYDHIRYRLRGAFGRYDGGNTKRSMRFRFNRGSYLKARDADGKRYSTKWRTLTIGKGFDAYRTLAFSLNEHINFYLFNKLGVPAPYSHYFHFRVVDASEEAPDKWRGDFWGLFFAQETYDVRFIDAHDLAKGNLYKLVDGVSDPNEQQRYQAAFAVTNGADFDNIEDNLTGYSTADFIRNHVRLDKWYAYHSICQAVRHYDFRPGQGKNATWYFEPVYTPENNNLGLMWILPWDTDCSWGPTWNHGYDDVYNSIFPASDGESNPELQPEYYNNVREIRDLLWQQDQIEPLIDELAAPILEFAQADMERWLNAPSDAGNYDNLGGAGKNGLAAFVQDMKGFAFYGGSWLGGGSVGRGGRATFLDSLADGTDGGQIPVKPSITYLGGVGYPVNALRFACSAFADPQGGGTFAAMKWRIAEVTDESAPSYDVGDRRKYEIESVWESGEMTAFQAEILVPAIAVEDGHAYRIRCRMKDTSGRWSHWSAPIQFIAGEPVSVGVLEGLRITEMMYNPAGADTAAGELNVDNDEFEFIELKNVGGEVLDLTYVSFIEGITFDFNDSDVEALGPGKFVLVVRNKAAFESRYPGLTGIIAGQYIDSDSKLSNGGETVHLADTWHGTIAEFSYSDGRGWPLPADGSGHSQVPLSSAIADEPSGSLNYGGNWRMSGHIDGSPGQDDWAFAHTVVINEVMAHTDYDNPANPEHDSDDWIELYNTSSGAINLSGWYLSDDKDELKKWAIPSVNISGNGRISFSEVDDFHNPIQTGFGLDKAGEEVLLSNLPGNSQDRVVDYVRFKGEENSISLGRYPDGGDYWLHQSSSRDLANTSGVLDIVIDEVMYHPVEPNDEYVELYNPTASRIDLDNSASGWRLDDEDTQGYTFDAGAYIEPGGRLVVVGFDPATETVRLNDFIAAYAVGRTIIPGVDIVGPFDGNFANGGERLALKRPQAPDDPGDSISWVIVDEVIYADAPPWPVEPDGLGSALQRINADGEHSGNDPANWRAAPPSPTKAP